MSQSNGEPEFGSLKHYVCHIYITQPVLCSLSGILKMFITNFFSQWILILAATFITAPMLFLLPLSCDYVAAFVQLSTLQRRTGIYRLAYSVYHVTLLGMLHLDVYDGIHMSSLSMNSTKFNFHGLHSDHQPAGVHYLRFHKSSNTPLKSFNIST